jgi:hypothetical protein
MACPEVACRRITACSGRCSAALMPSVGQSHTSVPDGQDAGTALLHSCALPRQFSLFVRRDPGMSQLGVGLTSWSRCADRNVIRICHPGVVTATDPGRSNNGLDRLDLSHERRATRFVWNLSALDLGLT